jgi:hypothetical protein
MQDKLSDLGWKDKYDLAMKVTDQASADAILEACVGPRMRDMNSSRGEAAAFERRNLAYYAGYHDDATRERVERLFGCAHPVFGAIAVNGPPTADEALRLGIEMGERIKASEDLPLLDRLAIDPLARLRARGTARVIIRR